MTRVASGEQRERCPNCDTETAHDVQITMKQKEKVGGRKPVRQTRCKCCSTEREDYITIHNT